MPYRPEKNLLAVKGERNVFRESYNSLPLWTTTHYIQISQVKRGRRQTTKWQAWALREADYFQSEELEESREFVSYRDTFVFIRGGIEME